MLKIDCACKKQTHTISLDVAEVEIDPISDDAEDEAYPRFRRELRIKTLQGDTLVLDLNADQPERLEVRPAPQVEK